MAVQINVAANQAALTASIQAGVQAYNQRFAQNNQLNLTVNQRAFSQPLGRMTGDVKDFEAALAASNARVIAFGASTAVLGGVIRSFKELASVTIDVEKNLADINRVFGLTTSQLQKFSTDLFNVSKQTASSFDDASKAALEFSRQGLKAEDTLQRTKDALTLTRLAGISTANAVDALTSTVNGFAATGITTTQILNKLVAVEQDYAVGAGDLAEALSRTGQAAQEAGVSLDQLNALVTSAQQSTARGGAVIGNALKTIFTRLQRTETLDQLEAFNIAVRDVEGNILPAVQILQNFAGAYRGLADAQRAQLSEQVAGVYQVNILKAIVNDLNKSQGTYAGALKRGASATNEAEVATAKLNQTLDALLKQTAVSTQQLANNIGKVTFEPLAKYGAEQLKSFVESINDILEGEDAGSLFANGLLKGIRNVIAGPGAIAAFFTLFKLIQNSFTYLSQALPQIAGITTETQNRKNIEQSILQIMQQQGPASQALAGLMGNQAAQAQLLLQIARQQTAEYQMQSTLAKQLAAQLANQGVRVKGSGGLQVTRAGGYIPNATRMAEVVGAQAGGYTPGRVVSSPVGGVMNTAEDVKYIPGFAQPFINPPAASKAGRAHRQNAINRTGVDPYMYSGFIPNFAQILDVAENPYNVKDGDTITADATIKRVRDFRLEKIDAVESNQLFGDQATNVAKKLYPKASDFAPAINASGKAAYDRLSFISQPLVDKLIDKGYGVPDLRYTNDQSLINRTEFAKKAKKGVWSQVSSRGLYTHPKAIQFLDQMGISKNEMDEEDKKYAMYKAAKAGRKKYGLESFFGFIPNFAPAVDSARIPWFKKYSSIYRNKSTDKDVFRQKDFPTFGDGSDHYYAINGNPDMMSYLYEDFLKSALNIALGSKQVVKPQELGFKNTVSNEISNRNPFDLTRKLSGNRLQKLEAKQSKNNQKETITQITDSKFKSLLQENPELAKNVDLMTVIFNDPRYVDPTGKNPAGILNPFEQSISSVVKNSYADVDPNTKTKLGKLTDGLLKRYEIKKNKKFGSALFEGFIPNFAYKQAVMGLEESMSGNKAIFDIKPFPHIRNSSQPTFSSAIADHGGLGNALSDSMRGQKAAGLMHGGFIPNFGNSRSARRKMARNQTQSQSQNAQSGFDPAILQAEAEKIAKNVVKKMKYAYDYIGVFAAAFADTIEKGSQQAKAALSSGMSKIKVSASNLGANVSNSVNNAASNVTNQNTSGGGGKSIMGAFGGFGKRLGRIVTNPFFSIATSSIAGQIESFYSQNRTREKLSQEDRLKSTALSSALNFGGTAASVGGMIAGVPGAIIGGIGGSLVGLGKAIIDSRTNLEDLTKQYQESISKQQENSQAASEYISLQTKLINSTSTNFEENKKISREAALAFSSIKDSNLKIALNNAGNDIEKMSKVLEEYSLKQKEVTINIEKFSNGIVGLNKKIANEKGFSTSGASTSGFMGIKTVQNAMTYVTSLVSGQPSNKYLSTLDVSTQQNREKIYAESSGFFELITDLSTKEQDVLQLAIQKMFTETGENLKGGLESVISGLDLPEQKKTILSATLRQAKDEGSLLLNTLFNKDDYNILAQGFSEYNNSLKENIKMENNRIVSLANLNYALKQSEKSLDRKVQDLSRENETVGKLERIRSKNVISGYEQLFGKKASLDISYGFEEEQINLTQIKNNADILNKLLKSQPANLSDEAKMNLIDIRKRINPYNPERTISEMQDFISETYKTTDPLQLVGEGKVLFDAISQAVEDLEKNSKDSADQLIVAAQEIKSAAEEFDRLSNFTYQFRSGFRDLATEGQMLIGTIGRQLPKMFADGLVDGIKAAIRESDNLGQALMGIAAKFLDEISTMMLRSSIYQIMGSFAPSLIKGNEYALMTQKQKGGLIRAQSGMYVSGSGTGDKYPALLENGEYVLNRRAVMAMGGPASLDQLNFAMAPRFASGGSFSNEFTDLKSMEANMTSYGMENSKLYGELRDAEVAAAEERRRKAFANKQQRAALIGSLVAAVASIGMSAGLKNLSDNKLSAQAGSLGGTQEAKDVASMPLGKGEKFAGSEVAQFVTPKQYNQINSLMQQGYLNSAGTATTQSYSGFKGFFTGPTAYGQLPWYQRGSMNPFAPKIGRRQTGGLIGSRLSDTIPGYMEGGLYNTPIVKRYGVGMQAGGVSPISNSNSNVVNTTNATNSFNFNTNVSRDGTIEVGSSSTSYAQQDVALSKNLNSKVYAVVLDAIKNEQRFGGSLAGTRQG